ncbi:helix-turn-helix transcriptional regulator [Photobacterium sp. DNB22_13_2]
MSLNLFSATVAKQQSSEQNDQPDPISHHLSHLIEQQSAITRIYLAAPSHNRPPKAWQLNMPRIDIVLTGSTDIVYSVDEHHSQRQRFSAGDVLYIPSMGWSQPQWGEAVTLLSLNIAPHKVGFSLYSREGDNFTDTYKRTSVHRNQAVGNGLVQVLQALGSAQSDTDTISLVLRSLLSHLMLMEQAPKKLPSRQEELFHKITKHINENYNQSLNREEVAREFHISPNYLSHIFQHQGKTSFKDYLCHKRMENAQRLLEVNHQRIKQISQQCGFSDTNYFCRLFKQKTGLTPSQFRAGMAA